MTKNKYVPYKPPKNQNERRSSFGGYTNPAVTEFENQERTTPVFAWFGQDSLDEEEEDRKKVEDFLDKKRTYRLNAWFGQKSLREDKE